MKRQEPDSSISYPVRTSCPLHHTFIHGDANPTFVPPLNNKECGFACFFRAEGKFFCVTARHLFTKAPSVEKQGSRLVIVLNGTKAPCFHVEGIELPWQDALIWLPPRPYDPYNAPIDKDICLIELQENVFEASGAKEVTLRTNNLVPNGSTVVLHSSSPKRGTVRGFGMVPDLRPLIDEKEQRPWLYYIEFDGGTDDGDSGAPVVDAEGRLFGLLNGRSASSATSVVIVMDAAMEMIHTSNRVKLATAIHEERWALVRPFH